MSKKRRVLIIITTLIMLTLWILFWVFVWKSSNDINNYIKLEYILKTVAVITFLIHGCWIFHILRGSNKWTQ